MDINLSMLPVQAAARALAHLAQVVQLHVELLHLLHHTRPGRRTPCMALLRSFCTFQAFC